jgi:hypothetical protein
LLQLVPGCAETNEDSNKYRLNIIPAGFMGLLDSKFYLYNAINNPRPSK